MVRLQPFPRMSAILLLLALTNAQPVRAEDKAATPAQPEVVAAKVGDDEVYERDVEIALLEALKGRPIAREALPKMQAEMLGRLVDRRLIMRYLVEHKMGASEAELDLFVKQLVEKVLEPQNKSLADYLKQSKISEAEFRRQLTFQIGWNKYLKDNISDEKLYQYYKDHLRDYDGTEVRVSHILLRPAGTVNQEVVDKLKQQATQIREQIEAGKITFAEAATKYSAGPSRLDGGDLGFFPRHGVMAEPFSAAAFGLQKGQMSDPVLTNFGIHLIYLTDVHPGANKWDVVKPALSVPFAQELFEEMAAEQRKVIQPQFTGAVPYFKPGSNELVVGKPSH